MSFVHCHRHSEYSRLDGIGTAQQYAARAAEIGQTALGLTDHGTLSGVLHHIRACSGKDGKGKRLHDPLLPLIGCECYFRPDRAHAKLAGERKAWHLCLFAKSLRGWHNLLRIVSTAYGEPEEGGGFYQYPCVDWELLERHSEGLICSTACISSWLSHLVGLGHSSDVDEYITRMLKIFGDDLFIEIMPHDFDDQRTLNVVLAGVAKERSVPLIATNDAHFPLKEWAETHRVAKMLGANKSFADITKDVECGKAEYLSELTPTLYLAHEEEMRFWFSEHHPGLSELVVDEAIVNTGYLVSRVKPFMLDKTDKLPRVSESPAESETLMWDWIVEGLERVGKQDDREYLDRVATEFEILKSKGVLDYFILVGDVCRWAKSEGIRVGLGRGSAAGCLISYLIGITAIDPIPYGLLFERFLSPSRKGLPDIDLDFDSDRRQEVKDYLAEKYGHDHVADIITHSTFQPKAVIQDISRVFNVPFLESKAVTDTIEIRQDDEETTLEELVPINDVLAAFKEKYPEIWGHALRLEGTVRNASKHAAGVVITDRPITDYMALERGKKGDLVTSWSDAADFPAVSDHGFVKLDALGITGLSKHEYACRLVLQRTGKWVDLNALPALRDPYAVDEDVMNGFRDGYTIGVFQFGGSGITKLLKSIRPDNILDLSAANALYRPGPLKGGVVWDYAPRKHNAFLRTYWHDSIRPFLKETYGLIAYQEQVMQIAREIGGMSAGDADDLRKAMGKLYRIKGGTAAKDFMGKYEKQWFSGAAEHGMTRELAEDIWNKILEFGHYGFNKSHSASYALQAYQDMYLKMKFPLEFYAAFLTYEDDDEKIAQAMREIDARGYQLVVPDVNLSGPGYTIADGKLILGLMAIEGIGEKVAQQIANARPFHSFDDFVIKLPGINPRPLIESGAMDDILDRPYMLSVVLKNTKKGDTEWAVWEHLRHNHKLKNPRDVPEDRRELSLTQIRVLEKAALPISSGKLDCPPEYIKTIKDNIYSQDEVEGSADGETVIVGGQIKSVKLGKTKRGDPFATITLFFEMNEWRVRFWPEQYRMNIDILEPGKIIMVNGRKDEWNGFITVQAFDADLIEDVAPSLERVVAGLQPHGELL